MGKYSDWKRALGSITLVSGWLLLSLPGCGDSGGDSGTLPSTLEANTTLSWNPSLTILDATRFSYANTGDSDFTASITGGTYTYEANEEGASLVIDGESAGDGKLLAELPATLSLKSGAKSGQVTITIDGMNFEGTLTVPASEGDDQVGAGGTGGEVQGVTGMVPEGAVAATVNPGLAGSYDLVFGYPQADAPFKEGDKATFVVGADGSLTALGKKIDSPYELNGNKAAIYWNDGTYAWEVSNNESGVFNEINVVRAADMKWLGQWADASKFEGGSAESDIDQDIAMEIYEVMESETVMAPYAQGTKLTVSWDGKMALSVTESGKEPLRPSLFAGNELSDDGYTWRWSDPATGNEYRLGTDSENKKLLRLEVRAQNAEASSLAKPSSM